MDDIAALLRQDLQKPPRPIRGPRAGLALFRHAFVPLLLLASAIAWIFHADLELRLARAHAGVDAITVVLLVSLLAVWIAEQVYPANDAWNYNLADDPLVGLQRFGRDMVYLLVMTQATALLIKLSSLGLTSGLTALGPHGLALGMLWPSSAPFAVRVVLVFLITELASYGIHRAAHRVPLLWRFHSTHHVVEELSGLKSLRLHPLDNVVFYVARGVPLLLLGIGAEEILTVTYVACTLSILSHANVDVAESRLGWVINLPQYHQVHHSSDIEESNSNFGCHTVLWDRVFGTFRAAPKGTLVMGTLPLGRRSLWQELGWPFYSSRFSDPGHTARPTPQETP